MPLELMGVHANSLTGEIYPCLRDWKPPLVVTLDHSDGWKDFKEASPRTTIIGRLSAPHEYDPGNEAIDPIVAAREHCDAVLPHAEKMGNVYTFWQGINEPVIKTEDAMWRYSDFETTRVRIMKAHGFRVVIGSFSVGTPHFPLWHCFMDAIKEAYTNEGALALHEYSWPTLSYQSPWLLLRHRKVYEGEPSFGWDGFPKDLQNMPLYITESGPDRTLVGPPGGWRILYHDAPSIFMSELNWYNEELKSDKYVMASAIYCAACGGSWDTYNLHPEILGYLKQFATPAYRIPMYGSEQAGDIILVTCEYLPSPGVQGACSEEVILSKKSEAIAEGMEIFDEFNTDIIVIQRSGNDIIFYVQE